MCQGGKVGLSVGAYKWRNTVSYDFCAIPDKDLTSHVGTLCTIKL